MYEHLIFVDDEYSDCDTSGNPIFTEKWINPVFLSLKKNLNIPEGVILGSEFYERLKSILNSSKSFLIVTDIQGVSPQDTVLKAIEETATQGNTTVILWSGLVGSPPYVSASLPDGVIGIKDKYIGNPEKSCKLVVDVLTGSRKPDLVGKARWGNVVRSARQSGKRALRSSTQESVAEAPLSVQELLINFDHDVRKAELAKDILLKLMEQLSLKLDKSQSLTRLKNLAGLLKDDADRTAVVSLVENFKNDYTRETQHQSREKLLIVEDDAAQRTDVFQRMKNEGFDVVPRASGEEALKILRKDTSGEIELGVFDLNLPGISGQRLCGEVRKIKPQMVIFALTVVDDPVVSFELGHEHKFDGYFNKNKQFEYKDKQSFYLSIAQALREKLYERKAVIPDLVKSMCSMNQKARKCFSLVELRSLLSNTVKWRFSEDELLKRAGRDLSKYLIGKERNNLSNKYHIASDKASIQDRLVCRLVIIGMYDHFDSDEERIIRTSGYPPSLYGTTINLRIEEARKRIQALSRNLSGEEIDDMTDDPPVRDGINQVKKTSDGAIFFTNIRLPGRRLESKTISFRWYRNSQEINLLHPPSKAFDVTLERCALSREWVLSPMAHFYWERKFLEALKK